MRNPRGFTLIELLLVMGIVALLLAIAVTIHRSARVRGGEAVAIAALDAINQAQFAYSQTCGNQAYAPTLAALGTPRPVTNEPYLSPDLTTGDVVVKSGYTFRMSGTAAADGVQTCTGVAPVTSYQVTADPVAPGASGDRFFGTNTDRAIFEGVETFTGRMPETGSPEKGQEIQATRAR